jgi:dihydrofolate reductase
MRKLILQMQTTLDSFVARPNGDTDWMWISGKRDNTSFQKVISLAESCDTILLGRKMTPVFVQHWENVVDNQPDSQEHYLGQLMVNMRKIVFSHTQTDIKGRNLEVENGDIKTAVNALKSTPGKDIIVYGGANFVNSLISDNLVDEYYFFIHPIAIGEGLSIFKDQKQLKLESITPYDSGKVLAKYIPE